MKRKIEITRTVSESCEFIGVEKKQVILTPIQAKFIETVVSALKTDKELMQFCCSPAVGKSKVLHLLDEIFDEWTERNSWDLMQDCVNPIKGQWNV